MVRSSGCQIVSTVFVHGMQLNLSLEALGDFVTLSERLQAEVQASNTTTPLPDLVSASARKPAI